MNIRERLPLRPAVTMLIIMGSFAFLPLYAGAGTQAVLVGGLTFLILCYAWNIVGGFLGELSLAHMVFWGLGSYGFVWALNHEWSPWLTLVTLVVGGVILGAAVASLIRLARLETALYVAIFTLILAEIVATYLDNAAWLGASEGIIVTVPQGLGLNAQYLLLVLLASAVVATNLYLSNSSRGMRWRAIRDEAIAAATTGINVNRERVYAYALSAAFCVLGGAFQAYYSSYARPDVSLSTGYLVLALLAVYVGGPGTALGPLAGATIIYGLDAAVTLVSSSLQASLYAQVLEFTVALILMRTVLPRLGHSDLASAAGSLLEKVARGAWRKRPTQNDATVAPVSGLHPPEVGSVVAVIPQDPPQSPRSRAWSAPSTTRDGDRSLKLLGGIEIRNLAKWFGAVRVLRDVNFHVNNGEVVGIVGPNGAGKSTLCNILSGLESASGGSITVNGVDILRLPAYRRSSSGFGRAFQTPRLFSSLRLSENLVTGTALAPAAATQMLAGLGVQCADARWGDDSDFYARRLTEVARARALGGSVLLLDEPLAGLTEEQREAVLSSARAAADAGAAVLIVEHLIPVLAPAVDRIVVLANGAVIADGLPRDVLTRQEVVDTYLGRPVVLP